MFVEGQPKRVVVRVSAAVHLIDVPKWAGRVGSRALGRQYRTGEWEGSERPGAVVHVSRHERLVDILGELKVGGLQTHIGRTYPHTRGNLPLDREVPILGVHIVEAGVDRTGSQTDSDNGCGGVLEGNGTGSGAGIDGQCKRRVPTQAGDDIHGRVLGGDGVSGAN